MRVSLAIKAAIEEALVGRDNGIHDFFEQSPIAAKFWMSQTYSREQNLSACNEWIRWMQMDCEATDESITWFETIPGEVTLSFTLGTFCGTCAMPPIV